MLPLIGLPVQFVPHAEHYHLTDHPVLAATIGRLNADGTADLAVFVPNKEMSWMDKVPQGTGPYTWHHLTPDGSEPATEAVNEAAEKHAPPQPERALVDNESTDAPAPGADQPVIA